MLNVPSILEIRSMMFDSEGVPKYISEPSTVEVVDYISVVTPNPNVDKPSKVIIDRLKSMR